MKNGKFALTSNVQRFLAGITIVEERGAGEAGMLLVTGEAGYGKSRTVQWWAVQHGAVYVRATASMTPNWLLRNIVRELGHAAENSNEKLFTQVLTHLLKSPLPLVIDEVEHTMHDHKVLETVRDITDLTEIPVVLVGMEKVQSRIARYGQISSRIAHVVRFEAATLEDVRACCETLAECRVEDKLLAEIQRQTSGRVREIINAIAVIERHAKRNKIETITLEDMKGQILTHDWQARKPRFVTGGHK